MADPKNDRDTLIVVSPAGRPDGRIVVGAGRAQALGVLDLGDGENSARAEMRLVQRRFHGHFAVRITTPAGLTISLPDAVDTVLLGHPDLLGRLHGRRQLVEVTSLAEARDAVDNGADGLIAKGAESGGRVGEESTFVLLQRLRAAYDDVPIWAQGGIGCHTAAAAIAGGATGVVIDSQVALTTESGLPTPVRRQVAAMDGTETTVADGWRRYQSAVDTPANGLPLGQDAALAAGLAGTHKTVGGIVQAMRAAMTDHVALAQMSQPLAPGNGVAESLGTTYPIVQGPMTRVSDRAGFADAVARHGGLPLLALSLLRADRVREVMTETQRLVGDNVPWGVGILGFAPPELREEQLAVIRDLRPPVVLIAGGRPSQATPLEAAGIKTFLHVPSPGLLDQFLAAGATRLVFEGRECGGHVGPRSSFVLWEQQIDRLLRQDDLDGYDILFAGGIHDDRSAAMVATLAAPLVARGARIGVVMGTAYLFTEEATATGAITDSFQAAALECENTVLLETAPGHATRCADSPYVASFRQRRTELETAAVASNDMWEQLEELNLGRLRIAAKGITREDDELVPVSAEGIRRDGMFMLGEVAGLRRDTGTVADLHHDVSIGGADRVAAMAPAAPKREEARPLRIAIIGSACVFPGAVGTGEFWANVVAGADAITEVPAARWDIERFYRPDGVSEDGRPVSSSKWGGFVPDLPFDPMAYGIPPRALASIGTDQLISLEIARQALADAGYADRPFDRDRATVVFGAEPGNDLGQAYGARTAFAHFTGSVPRQLAASLPELTEDSFPGVLGNVIAGRIANRLDLGGANFTVDAACGSSLAALNSACHELTSGNADLALCGAVDLHNGIHDFALFTATKALSPTGRCRPFDADADGIALGEGAACVVLKRLEDAERDGDRILAVIDAVAASSDGRSLGLTAPRREGQRRAIDRALVRSGTSPAEIGLVEAHGTGTVVGDRTELSTLTDVYAEHGVAPSTVALGSVKSQIGHTKCVAGLAGLLKVVHAIDRGVLPPTRISSPNAAYDAATSPFVFNDRARPWLAADRRAAISAFGFGGTNFHAVVSRYRGGDEPRHGLDAWPSELFCIRGADAAQLDANLDRLTALLEHVGPASPHRLRDLARTVTTWSETAPIRATIVADDVADLRAKIGRLRSGANADGVFRSTGAGNAPDVALLFPGQGSQRVHMLSDLLIAFPMIRHHVTAAGGDLAAKIFPPASFGAGRQATTRALTDTRVAQPALGVVELAVADLLTRCGVEPSAAAGHSFGELTALAVAGALPVLDLAAFGAARGQAILDASPADDPGTMAAVRAGAEEVQATLGGDVDVIVANDNSPSQCVISGPTASVAAAVGRLEAAGLSARPIPVACAFHTPVLASATTALAERLAGMAIAPPQIPVWSNTTAAPYPDDVAGVRELIARQVSTPVAFREQIEAMYAVGIRAFVEAGPGRVLTQLVDAILGDRPHRAIAVDVPGEPGIRQLLLALAELAGVGVPIETAPLFEGRDAVVLDEVVRQPAPFLINGAHVLTPDSEAVPGSLRPATEHASIDVAGTAAVPAADTDDDRERLVTDYLRSMREMAQQQRDVMLSLLGTPPPAPAPMPPAAESAAPAAPPRTEPAAVTPAPTPQDLRQTVIAIVSDRTGYPADMIDPAFDLEAELSIDSIKRVEIIGELTHRIDLPGADTADRDTIVEELSRIKTINAMVDWIDQRSGSRPAATTNGAAPEPAAPSEDELRQTVIAIVSDRTGYPADMIDPAFDLEAELSIDSIKRVEIIGELTHRIDLPGADTADRDTIVEELSRIKTINAMVAWIDDHISTSGSAPAPEPEPEPEPATDDEPMVTTAPERPLRFVPRLAPAPPSESTRSLAELRIAVVGGEPTLNHYLQELLADDGAHVDLVDPHDDLPSKTTTLLDLTALGQVGDPVAAIVDHFARLRSACDGGVEELVVVTALGGGFALDDSVPDKGRLAVGSAAAAMAKTFARELDCRTRVVDLDTGASMHHIAERLSAAMREVDPPVELGITAEHAWTVVTEPAADDTTGPVVPLGPESVVVVTGGARGIGAATARELARRYGCGLELIGRSPLPAVDDPDHITAAGDEGALRAALIRRGELTRPADIEAEVGRILAAREIRETMAELGRTASYVDYHAVDVTDPYALTATLQRIREARGRIDGALHAAGIRDDRFIGDKTPESFARVLLPKLIAADVLAHTLDEDAFLVLFGSVAGYFGNVGQVDYAAANAVLDGMARAGGRGGPRVLSVDWGPWAGGGMVTPELATEYARRGIGLIDRTDGVDVLLSELDRGLPEPQLVVMCAALEQMQVPATQRAVRAGSNA